MNNIELIKNYEWSGRRYRFSYDEFSDEMKWEELIKVSWWQSLFRMDGQEYVWKTIYSGHVIPINECLKTYEQGHEFSTK